MIELDDFVLSTHVDCYVFDPDFSHNKEWKSLIQKECLFVLTSFTFGFKTKAPPPEIWSGYMHMTYKSIKQFKSFNGLHIHVFQHSLWNLIF